MSFEADKKWRFVGSRAKMLSRGTREGYDTVLPIASIIRIRSDSDLERLERRVGKVEVKKRRLPEILRLVRFEHVASHSHGRVSNDALRKKHTTKVVGSRDARIVSIRLEGFELVDLSERCSTGLRQ